MTVKQRIEKESFGFITEVNMPLVIQENPNYKLLVRCGCGRFVVSADQAKHFIDIITSQGSDYVRDVSFVA